VLVAPGVVRDARRQEHRLTLGQSVQHLQYFEGVGIGDVAIGHAASSPTRGRPHSSPGYCLPEGGSVGNDLLGEIVGEGTAYTPIQNGLLSRTPARQFARARLIVGDRVTFEMITGAHKGTRIDLGPVEAVTTTVQRRLLSVLLSVSGNGRSATLKANTMVSNALLAAIEARRGATRAQRSASVAAPSVGDELAKLIALRDAGELSESEFNDLKARLIG
jgi:hypothetical protein